MTRSVANDLAAAHAALPRTEEQLGDSPGGQGLHPASYPLRADVKLPKPSRWRNWSFAPMTDLSQLAGSSTLDQGPLLIFGACVSGNRMNA